MTTSTNNRSKSDHDPGLVRFIPKSEVPTILIGEPIEEDLDIGLATREGKSITVTVFSGTSVLSPGVPTYRTESVERILSPLAQEEVGTIRCIGLNVGLFQVPFDMGTNVQIVCPTRKGGEDGHSHHPNPLP